jgi:NMD protein affecting ribosome stability and mRNA decay
MARTFRQTSAVKKLPPRDREAENEEYGREHKGILECPECHNVHFKKRWYASVRDLEDRLKKKIDIFKQQLCPACAMIKSHLFEGELFTEDFPAEQSADLLRLIRNFGKQATETDPQDRIISIEKVEKGYRTTTTENQLVNKLAKKIKDAFNTVDVRFSKSPEPSEVARVHIVFRKK